MEELIFNQLPLSAEVLKALARMGFTEATPIQALAIPPILQGRDVIGQARTGTGKTCAFGIPAVENVDLDTAGVQALALCPTRELAIQMAEELSQVCRYKKGVHILALYGGQSIERQILALKKRPQIIVGTPGRIMDHLRRHTLKVDHLRTVVLDEADEMLNMGFREDIDAILSQLPRERQTLLFSATMPQEILDLTALYQKDAVFLRTVEEELTVPAIDQYYIEVREQNKLELLCRLVDYNNVRLGLVFVNTKLRADAVAQGLQTRGFRAEALHGDMKQLERDRVMNRFRKGQLTLLVATDVAARGIDVAGIDAVFNYDLPGDAEYYVHRIGRTGRAGNFGVSYSFVFGRDHARLRAIQRYTKSKILPMKAPTVDDVERVRLDLTIGDIQTKLDKGRYGKYLPVIRQILNGDTTRDSGDAIRAAGAACDSNNAALGTAAVYSAEDVAAVLFGMAFREFDKRRYTPTELDEPPKLHRFLRNPDLQSDRRKDDDSFHRKRFSDKRRGEKRRDWDEQPPYNSKREANGKNKTKNKNKSVDHGATKNRKHEKSGGRFARKAKK